MPTPIEILLDPISLIVLTLFGSLMLWEALLPGRTLPKISGWKIRGLIAFTVFFYLSSYLPLIWDRYLIQFQVFDLSGLGTLGGSLIGILILELGTYIWHWMLHKSDFLWRVCHQMHHSAERVDTYGAFWFSPLDMVGWTLLGSICLTVLIGVNTQAATVILLLTTFLTIFQHANIKTPRWLGYIIQRPESHAIHHGKGIHACNYSDLPLFDILFGTFNNPEDFEVETGFYEGASERVIEMLMFKDVTRPKTETREQNVSK